MEAMNKKGNDKLPVFIHGGTHNPFLFMPGLWNANEVPSTRTDQGAEGRKSVPILNGQLPKEMDLRRFIWKYVLFCLLIFKDV